VDALAAAWGPKSLDKVREKLESWVFYLAVVESMRHLGRGRLGERLQKF